MLVITGRMHTKLLLPTGLKSYGWSEYLLHVPWFLLKWVLVKSRGSCYLLYFFAGLKACRWHFCCCNIIIFTSGVTTDSTWFPQRSLSWSLDLGWVQFMPYERCFYTQPLTLWSICKHSVTNTRNGGRRKRTNREWSSCWWLHGHYKWQAGTMEFFCTLYVLQYWSMDILINVVLKFNVCNLTIDTLNIERKCMVACLLHVCLVLYTLDINKLIS